MKSIKKRILVSIGSMVVIFVLLVGVISNLLSLRSSEKQLELSMKGTVKVTADRIEKELEAYSNIAEAAGGLERISNPNIVITEKKEIVDSWAKEYGFERGNLLDMEGNSLFDGKNYADRIYFQEASKGNAYISTPVISKVTGKLTIMVAAPVWEKGKPGSNVVGVICFVPHETFLNDIMASIKVSAHSGAYMIDQNGYTIADLTLDTVTVQNIEKEAAKKKEYKALAEIHKKMREGGSGFATYKLKGEEKVIAYEPIEGSDGWSVGITAPKSDFQKAAIQGMIIVIICIVLAIICALLVAWRQANQIANPIKMCVKRLEQLSDGDLRSDIPEIHSQDETGVLAETTAKIVDTIKALIRDEVRVLGAMAKGDFAVYPEEEIYVGDLEEISQAMDRISIRLSETLEEIDASVSQVSIGAEQVAAGAQSLSQGSVEQASSVSELAVTIESISGDMQKTAEAAETAKSVAEAAGSALSISYGKMQELSLAMEDMNKSSEEIGKIIKTIEDIAFQTNILALNAAVEAARAGEAGKGFAVVADEVRNLASKSSMASKNTSELIEHSLHSIELGTKLAVDTKETMDTTAENARSAVEMMADITEMVKDQAESAVQITAGIDQISTVVQTNSATAEESAATSEELSSQAEIMKKMVQAFELRKNRK